jgi:hypothetical protein
MLIDCGKASRVTRGFMSGLFWEGGLPPYQHYNNVCPGGAPKC